MNHRTTPPLRSRRARRSGQAVVEVLFVSIAFLMLFMYGLQWCYLAICHSLLNTAAYGAARFLATAKTQDDAGDWAHNTEQARKIAAFYLAPVASDDDVTIFVTNEPSTFGQAFKVRIAMTTELLPLPLVEFLFPDYAYTVPDQRTIESYSSSLPNPYNLQDQSGNPITIQPDETITVIDKTQYGWQWVDYRYTIKGTYTDSHKKHDSTVTGYFPGTTSKDNIQSTDPWPNKYYTTRHKFPLDRTPPAISECPDYGLLKTFGGTLSFSTMVPTSANGTPADQYGPPIYQWTILVTKVGVPVKGGTDGKYSMYAWAAMSAD